MQEAMKEAQELQEKTIREAEEQLRKEEEAERERYIQILFILNNLNFEFPAETVICKSQGNRD